MKKIFIIGLLAFSYSITAQTDRAQLNKVKNYLKEVQSNLGSNGSNIHFPIAANRLDIIKDLYPDWPDIYSDRAMVAEAQGQCGIALFNYVKFYEMLDDNDKLKPFVEKKIKEYEKVFEENAKGNVLQYTELASCYAQENNNKLARKYYEIASRIEPENPYVFMRFGTFEEYYGMDYVKAAKYYLRSVELGKNEYLKHLSTCLMQSGQYSKFIEVMDDEALTADNYYNLATAYYKLNSFKKAANAFQKAIDLGKSEWADRGNSFYARLISDCYIKTGWSNFFLGKMGDAEEMFNEAIKEEASNVPKVELILAYYEAGDVDKAEVLKDKLIKESGSSLNLELFYYLETCSNIKKNNLELADTWLINCDTNNPRTHYYYSLLLEAEQANDVNSINRKNPKLEYCIQEAIKGGCKEAEVYWGNKKRGGK